MKVLSKKALREKVIKAIDNQGFYVNGHVVPEMYDKSSFKQIHSFSRIEQLLVHKNFLVKNTKKVKPFFIDGSKLEPEKISLEIREVESGSLDEIIYKWWNLMWWSVPYQRAFGRQMRFIIWDTYHNAPFGLIGLQSPVLKIAVRDQYLEIPKDELDIWVNKSMQAQRLGALPPYNELIGGKMVALAMTCNEIREAYRNKYADATTLLEKRKIEPDLLFMSTTSAFGKSSIYNRLKFKDEVVAKSLGYTKGSGTFHINEELFKDISAYLKKKGENVSTKFGQGPSRRLKILGKAFSYLDLPNYSYHNIKREFFLFPLTTNLKDVIHKGKAPVYVDRPFSELSKYWLQRWCLPRSERKTNWKNFKPDDIIKSIELVCDHN